MMTTKPLSPSKIITINVDDSILALALKLGATEVISSVVEKAVLMVPAGTLTPARPITHRFTFDQFSDA